jgi:hypothetical protein
MNASPKTITKKRKTPKERLLEEEEDIRNKKEKILEDEARNKQQLARLAEKERDQKYEKIIEYIAENPTKIMEGFSEIYEKMSKAKTKYINQICQKYEEHPAKKDLPEDFKNLFEDLETPESSESPKPADTPHKG